MGVPGHSELGSALSAIDRTVLTPVVRRCLESPTLDVLDWTYRPLLGGTGDMGAGASGLYRFTGQARDQSHVLSWSLVLKICTARLGSAEPSGWNYWPRECLAYESGLLEHLPGGLAAPRCYGAALSPELFSLWLEDVTDELGPHWPLARYSAAARHLGQFNGAYLVELPLPSAPWLSAGWLRNLVAQAAPVIARLQEPLSDPLIRRALPADVVAGILRLWAEHKFFLDALDRLPQTLCHRDAFRRNLFARRTPNGQEQTVAIDWAFAGIDAVGTELAPLVIGSLAFDEVEMDQAEEFEQLAFEGYLEGLREAGWRGEVRQARFGYAATAPLIYAVGYLYAFDLGQEAVGDWTVRFCRFLLKLADEARRLLGSLDEE
jgi:hypothetical protein